MKKCIYSMFLLLAAFCMSTSCMKEVIYVDSPYQQEVNPGSRAINPDFPSVLPPDDGGPEGKGEDFYNHGSGTTFYFDNQSFTQKLSYPDFDYTIICNPSNQIYPQATLLNFKPEGRYPNYTVKYSGQGFRIESPIFENGKLISFTVRLGYIKSKKYTLGGTPYWDNANYNVRHYFVYRGN